MRLLDKVVVVTGAAGGIGSAIARCAAQSGAKIVLADLNSSQAEARAASLRDDGHEALAMEHDVRSESSWSHLMEQAVQDFGAIDVVVNNAGISARTGQPFDDIEYDDWRQVMSVNLDGTFLGGRAAVRAMKGTGGGSIINIASIAAFRGTPGGAAYGTSKGALQTLTRQMSYSCAKHHYNIRVNAVYPGNVWTDLLKARFVEQFGSEEKALAALAGSVPLGRMVEPDDVAWAVVFLASDQARMITGTDLVVDGGSTAG